MGRLPCNHHLLHYSSRRVIVDFRVIADFHVIKVVSGTLVFCPQALNRVLTCIRNFFCRFTWIRNQFLLQIDDFGPKHLFCSAFNELGARVCVGVVGTFSSYLNAIILYPFRDFELAVFKPFFMKMFKFFLRNIYLTVFGVWPWLIGQASVCSNLSILSAFA